MPAEPLADTLEEAGCPDAAAEIRAGVSAETYLDYLAEIQCPCRECSTALVIIEAHIKPYRGCGCPEGTHDGISHYEEM